MIQAAPPRSRSFREGLRRLFLEPAGAEIALDFSSAAVLGARVESTRGRTGLRAIASESLREGAFAPTLEDPGFVAREEMRDAVKRVLSRLGAVSGVRAALVVPDVVARFRLFTKDEVGPEPKNRDAVIAFRMQKLLPFAPADVRVISAWPRSSADPVLGIGFSAAVVGAYEQVGRAFGLDVGSVETSSMALLRGLSVDGDVLLVRHDPAWLTVTLVRHGWPISIRTLDATVAGSRTEVRREIASTAVYWRDRLGGERLAAAFVHASDPWFEALGAEMASEFGCVAQRVQPPSRLAVAGLPTATLRSATPALALLEGR